MRVVPPPLSVILLPPSMTSLVPLSLNTFAVWVSTIVAGSAPQSKVMMPPLATAATNASPVQLAGVPVPMTVVGFETSSGPASGGSGSCPSGLPAGGPDCGFVGGTAPPSGSVPLDDELPDDPPDDDEAPLLPPLVPLAPPLDPAGAELPELHAVTAAKTTSVAAATAED